jgi:ABC-type multidrug transport system permease subunit
MDSIQIVTSSIVFTLIAGLIVIVVSLFYKPLYHIAPYIITIIILTLPMLIGIHDILIVIKNDRSKNKRRT